MASNSVFKPYTWSSEVFGAEFVVEFPKAPDFELICLGAKLRHIAEGHDVLLLKFKGKPFKKDTQLAYKDPVRFTYTSGKNKSVFVGTVNRIKTTGELAGVGNTYVECISASAVLKESAQKIYKNVTADQVVAKIAASMGMQSVCQRDPRVRPAIAHTGQTYWQFLRTLAKQTGFALRAENTTITFCSKDKITAAKKSGAPYFFYADTEGPVAVHPTVRSLGSIISYRPIISDASPERGAMVDRVITGQNKQSGKAVKTTHTKPKPKAPKTAKAKKAAAASKKGAVKPNKGYFV